MPSKLLFLLVFFLIPSICIAEEAKYPDRVPIDEVIAIFPMAVKDIDRNMKNLIEEWMVDAVSQSEYDAYTKEGVEHLSEGQRFTGEVMECAGKMKCYYPIVYDCGGKWVLSGKVNKTSKGYILEFFLGDSQKRKIIRKRVITIKGDESKLRKALLNSVSSLLLGIEQKPEEEVIEERKEYTNEKLAYDVSKWTTFGVGLAMVAGGGTFAYLAVDKQNEYNDKFAKQALVDPSLKDDANNYANWANGLLISGGVVLGASVILFVLDALDIGEETFHSTMITPVISPDHNGLSFTVQY